MNRFEKAFSNPTSLLKKIGYIALIAFVCVYVYYQIAPREGISFETETALAVSIDKTEEAEGFIFRSEVPIPLNTSSTVTCVANDGQRVAAGEYVANAYRKELDLETGEQIKEIDKKLDILEKSNIGATLVISDISKIDAKANELLGSIYKSVSDNKLFDAEAKKDSLLIYLNKRAIASHSIENYTKNISELTSSRDALSRNLSEGAKKIIAPCAGYFSGETDGFEGIFDPTLLSTASIADFDALTSSVPDESIKGSSAGKIITDFTWYIAAKVTKKDAGDYEQGNNYTIRFPYSLDKEFKFTLERKIEETDKDDCVLVFKTNLMPESFNYTREQKIEIVNSRYTGLKIQKKALRIDKETGKKGVFVLVGDIIEFRLVEEIYEFDDYYLIDMDDKAYAFEDDKEKAESVKNKTVYSKLKLYDNVILYGKDLYHGKIIGK